MKKILLTLLLALLPLMGCDQIRGIMPPNKEISADGTTYLARTGSLDITLSNAGYTLHFTNSDYSEGKLRETEVYLNGVQKLFVTPDHDRCSALHN
jgi:uncharacterized lipoprotein NlpE involved in copper resistance